jgi:RNA polymerase sigma-70 factor (ECF subfamily)
MDTVLVSEGTRATTGERDTPADALADALAAHGPVLLATARVITMDADEAQDLVQVTFEIALRKSDQLRDPAALRAWLLRIEVREAFRVIRRLRRLVSLDGHVTDITTQPPDLAQRADVRAAMARLPKRTRAAIALHHMAGLSVAETAVAMGTSENTVKSQLRVGLARLREELGDG